jgi:hypothetical protein
MVQIIIWKGANNPDQKGVQQGDIVELLQDGQHPGKSVVSGTWDSAAIGGFAIIDIPGATRKQVRMQVCSRLGIGLDLPTLNKIAFVDKTKLPAAAITSLQDNGRVTATGPQFLSTLSFKNGRTLQEVQNYFTQNGEFPGALTMEYPE